MAQLPVRLATAPRPWLSLSKPATPPYSAPPTCDETRSQHFLPPASALLKPTSSTSFSGNHDLVNVAPTGIKRYQSMDQPRYTSWRHFSEFNSQTTLDNDPVVLGHANAARHQISYGKTSGRPIQSPVPNDRSPSPTFVDVPHPNALPYVVVSNERVHFPPSCSALPAWGPSSELGARHRLLGDTHGFQWDSGSGNATKRPAELEFWKNDQGHGQGDKNINNLRSRPAADFIECDNSEMTDACGGHTDTRSYDHHSKSCLFSCPGFLRPLPSPISFEGPTEVDHETPSRRIAVSAYLPLTSHICRSNSVHPSSRPLPQLRTPPYGIQTSHVRDLPRYSPLDTPGAIGKGDTFYRMTNKALPPIQTVLDCIESGSHQSDVDDSKDDPWNDQHCFTYLSYPSPSSSLNAAKFATPPIDSFVPNVHDDEFYRTAQEIQQWDERTQPHAQAEQTSATQQKYTDGPPVVDATSIPKSWALHDHPRLVNQVWHKRSTPSSYTSSDIERASSVESQFGLEGPYEVEPETTIFLGDFCATSPRSSSLVSADARSSLPVYSPSEYGASSTSFSSAKSFRRCSTLGQTTQEEQLPKARRRLVLKRPASVAASSSDESDSSGSDYEASVMRSTNTLANATMTKIRKQGASQKRNKAPEGAHKKKHSRRSVQRKTSLGASKTRSFQCDYCSMAFHRRHDMKRHSRLHTGEKPYKCPSKVCSEAFERNDQLRRHLEKTEACRKKAPSLSEHSFCQGVVRRKRR